MSDNPPAPDADRVNAYAEVVQAASCDVDPDKWWLPLSVRHSIARAVVALADREQATLLARIAELTEERDAESLAVEQIHDGMTATLRRAEAAERALADERARVEELRGALEASLLDASDWQESSEVMRDRLVGMTRIARTRGERIAELDDECEEASAAVDRAERALADERAKVAALTTSATAWGVPQSVIRAAMVGPELSA